MSKYNKKLSLLACALISAGLTQPAIAATAKKATLPWHKKVLTAADYGGDWSKVGAVYSVDLNDDKGIDILRQNKTGWIGAVKELISVHRPRDPSQIIFDIYDEKPHLYIANQAEFKVRGMMEQNTSAFADALQQDQVMLHFGKFDNIPGTDMMRAEYGSWGDDSNYSAQLYGGYKQDMPYSISGTQTSRFCYKVNLPEELNHRNGSWAYIGDYNNDGYDDILRAEFGDWANDNSNTVGIYYGGQGNNVQSASDCPSTTSNLGAVQPSTRFTVDGNSEGADTKPDTLFNLNNADMLIGDFNGDGFSDIFRYDTGSSISNSLGSDHSAVDIWFGLDNKEGRMHRSFMYADIDGNREYTSTDKHIDDFKNATWQQFRIGDFNGDGADDIMRFEGNDIKLYISRADKDHTDEIIVQKRRLGLFSEVTLTDVTSFNLDFKGDSKNPAVTVRIADFNNDGRDDILAFNGKPYILYSHIAKDKSGGPVALTLIEHSKTISNDVIDTDGFTAAKLGNNQLLEIADYSGDGYPDILYVPNNKSDATILFTPPYDPLQQIQITQQVQVKQMEGVTQKAKNFVFMNDNGTLKFMVRNENGWQEPKTVPLYSKNNDPRCINDLPTNGAHLTPALFDTGISYTGTVNLDDSKSYFAKPVCNTGYAGEDFDVIADNQYIYLFRASGNKVLLDRFIYKSEGNSLQRLVEARYKLTGQRYKMPSSVVVGTDPTSNNSTGNSATISIKDNLNRLFFEPAFEVPFTAIDKDSSNNYCQIGALTASIMSDKMAGHRFMLASSCKGTSRIQLATVRKGKEEPFDVTHFSYTDESNKTVNLPSANIARSTSRTNWNTDYFIIDSLDSLTFSTSIVDKSGKQQSFDVEFLISATGGDDIGIYHFPVEREGGFRFTSGTKRRSYSGSPAQNAGKVKSKARLHYGNDGLVHVFWRGDNKDKSRINQVYQATLDPRLVFDSSWKPDELFTNWSPGNTDINGVLGYSWPGVTPNFNENKFSDLLSYRTTGSIFKPPFGTYYQNTDPMLGSTIQTPVVFEYGDLIEKDGQFKGILRRSFVDALYQNNQNRFAFSQQNLFLLKAEYAGRISTNLEMIGFIEGAPPVPKENMGRDQNGKWGYSAAASEVSLTMDSDTTVGSSGNDAGGFDAAIKVGSGADIFSISVMTYINSSLTFEGNQGTDEVFSLGKTVQRKAHITGVPPATECSGIQTPYQDPCFKTNSDGSKTELWHPHNEGAIFATSLSVDSYALRHPVNNKLVGYQLDFQNAIVTDNVINFNVNPAYQVAGSLDGYIGNERVRSITTTSPYRSYFKPQQERKWIDQDDRQYQELLQRYEQAKSTTSGTSASEFVNDKLLVAKTAIADGACQTQESTAAASITDYYGHSLDFRVGAGFEYANKMTGTEIAAEVGGFYKRQFQQDKNKSQSITFALGLSCDIASEVQGPDNKTLPWAVNAYSVRSYFLPGTINNFKDLFDKVIHPTNPGDLTSALKQVLAQAKASPRKLWRIVHRVDAVSRVMQNPM